MSGNLSGHLEGVTVGDGLTDAAGSALEPVDSLMKYDSYLVLADYQAYVNSQEQVSEAYKDRDNWTRKSILNTARMGNFHLIGRFESTARRSGMPSQSKSNSNNLFRAIPWELGNSKRVVGN